MPYILDGRPLSPDRAFTATNAEGELTQFPANWIRLASEDEKAAIGITYSPDAPQADQRFYWGFDADGSLLPKDHAQLVDQWVAQTKTTAGTLLAPTDWYITRQAETSTAVPQEVLTRRAEIRAYSNAKELAIKATANTDALAAYVTSPDYSMWQQQQQQQPESSQGQDSLVFSDGVSSDSTLN